MKFQPVFRLLTAVSWSRGEGFWLDLDSVAPKIFQFIRLPSSRGKNMNHEIEIVHQNPVRMLIALNVARGPMLFLF